MPKSLKESALAYAKNGIPVFPVAGKIPLTEHGLKDATTDEKIINEWWEKWPEAGIAGVCGQVSNMIVLDIDPEHGGMISLNNIIRQYGKLPDCPKTRTGGGGFHIFFSSPGTRIAPAVGFRPGLDIRGDDSYVVLPPSIHQDGGKYEWINPVQSVTLPQMPEWLIKLISDKPRKNIESKVEGPVIADGQRNATMASIAGKLRYAGASEEAIFVHLMEVNKARCRPELSEEEIRMISKSISRYNTAEERKTGEQNDLRVEGKLLYDEIVSTVKSLIHLTQDHHSALIALYIFQTYFADLFPAVFYLGIRGTKGAGKTITLSLVSDLSYNGMMVGNSSVAALARQLNDRDKRTTIAIDELDELKGDIFEMIQAALRQGYRRGTFYARWDVKEHKVENIDIYGPKAFALRTEIEDALTDRTFLISMERKYDPQMIDKVIDNFIRDLSPLKQKLENFAIRTKSKYTTKDILDMANQPAFRARVKSIVSANGSPRDAELTAILLIVGDMIGVDTNDTVKAAIQERVDTFYMDSTETMIDIILNIWRDRKMPQMIEASMILDSYNQMLKDKGIRTLLTNRKFLGMLRDIGMRDNIELKRMSNGRMGIFISKETLDILEMNKNPYIPRPQEQTKFDEAPVQEEVQAKLDSMFEGEMKDDEI